MIQHMLFIILSLSAINCGRSESKMEKPDWLKPKPELVIYTNNHLSEPMSRSINNKLFSTVYNYYPNEDIEITGIPNFDNSNLTFTYRDIRIPACRVGLKLSPNTGCYLDFEILSKDEDRSAEIVINNQPFEIAYKMLSSMEQRKAQNIFSGKINWLSSKELEIPKINLEFKSSEKLGGNRTLLSYVLKNPGKHEAIFERKSFIGSDMLHNLPSLISAAKNTCAPVWQSYGKGKFLPSHFALKFGENCRLVLEIPDNTATSKAYIEYNISGKTYRTDFEIKR